MSKQFENYNNGSERLSKELDIISIIDSARTANILSMLILNKSQRLLAENLPINYIESNKDNDYRYPKTNKSIMSKSDLKLALEEMERSYDIN